jgi:hypothetical protein
MSERLQQARDKRKVTARIIAKARAHGIVQLDEHTKRRLRAVRYTSASQIKNFEGVCNRYWFYETVEGRKDDEAFKAPHLKRGTHVDLAVQHFYKTGKVHCAPLTLQIPDRATGELKTRVEHWEPLVRAALAHLPGLSPAPVIQARIDMPTYEGGPKFVGYPDLVYDLAETHLQIDDVKTRADLKWCTSAEELAADVQVNSYARWGYVSLGYETVSVAHVSARTKWDNAKGEPAPPRALRAAKPHGAVRGEPCACSECKEWLSRANRGLELPSPPIVLPRAQVEEVWNGHMVEVRAMVDAARTVKSGQELTPNTGKCSNIYGKPCPHRARCGFDDPFSMTDYGTQGAGTMGLMDRLKAMNSTNPAAPAATVNEPVSAAVVPALQQCNGAGMYEYPNGRAPLAVEAGHKCDRCKTLSVVTGSPGNAELEKGPVFLADKRQVLPPEVTPEMRTSTSEQSDAAEAKAKRGRPKKAEGALSGGALIEASIKLTAMGFTGDGIDKVNRRGDIQAALAGRVDAKTLVLTPEPSAEPETTKAPPLATVAGTKAQLAALGFTEEECKTLFYEGAVQEALDGRITPGMMRQTKTPTAAELANITKVVAEVHERAASHAAQILSGEGKLVEHPAHTMIREQAERVQRTMPGELSRPRPPREGGDRDGESKMIADDNRYTAQERVESTLTTARERTGRKAPKAPPVAPTIYVDCHPTKGADMPVALEVWLAPVAELAALAAVDRDGKSTPLDHWSFAPYVAKGLLASAIVSCLDSLPAAVFVDSRAPGADAFLEVVTPHAVLVVRGMR